MAGGAVASVGIVEHGQADQLFIAQTEVAVLRPAVWPIAHSSAAAAHADHTAAHAIAGALDLGDVLAGGFSIGVEQIEFGSERIDFGTSLIGGDRADNSLVGAIRVFHIVERAFAPD